MFQVKFEYREDEEFGGYGWIPQAYPHFNAASGFGLVHDVLEHFPEDDGDLKGEMKAFGSMINIRWLGGWSPLRGSSSNFSPAQNIGADLGRFLTEIFYSDKELKNPPRTYKLEEYAECIIQESLIEGKRLYLEELNGEEPMPNSDIDMYLTKMAGWMRVGYRQSVKRFYGACNYELAGLFSNLERAVNNIGGDFGQELTVSVHPRRLDFKVDVRYPYDDDYND